MPPDRSGAFESERFRLGARRVLSERQLLFEPCIQDDDAIRSSGFYLDVPNFPLRCW